MARSLWVTKTASHNFAVYIKSRSQNLSLYMTTLDSSSAESTMEHDGSPKSLRRSAAADGGDGPEVWGTFDRSFQKVQTVLDRNRDLIQQVNENHQSRTSASMVRNVALIREINGNISKVVDLYSDLNSDLSHACHRRNDSKT